MIYVKKNRGGTIMKKSYRIGLDIGGTKCAASLGEISGGEIRVLARMETPTLPSPEETLKNLAEFIRKIKAEKNVKYAGISCGGPLDSRTGVIVSPPNLRGGWHGFAIVSYVKEAFGLEASLQNDANACAVAEDWLGQRWEPLVLYGCLRKTTERLDQC